MRDRLPEPWLRGPKPAWHPIVRPFAAAITQVREDILFWTQGLTDLEVWARPMGVGAAGFHIRHIGGSADRLSTYLEGGPLSEKQMAELQGELEPGEPLDQLLAMFDHHLLRCEAVVGSLDPRCWYDAREVGRKRLPTTAGGLVTHIAEHSQRHTGQAIVTIQVVKAMRTAGLQA